MRWSLEVVNEQSHGSGTMDKLRLFRNLMVMAAADGKMTQEEIMFLALRSSHWGITDDQFQDALEFVKSDKAELELPHDPQERRVILRDLLRLMAVDGDLAGTERRLFAVAAASMGIESDELNRLIDEVVRNE
jgi:uncharacterized tellurite resistance protein B-like protein